MSDDRPGRRSTELRLALAMRGGVSCAVWTGGACCETAALRAAAGRQPAPESGVYAGLLDSCGYEDVDIDVLVGTGAGGINGVLLACHLVYGMPFGRGVRDLWLRLGDLEGLLRRSTPFHVPASLMRGDEVLYKELRGALGRLVDEAPQDRRPPASLRLVLTATRLRPRRDLLRPALGRPLPVGRSQAWFRFRHRGALTDFPDDVTGAARETALDRLAYAARTSASFPGAFEPGRVYVGNGAQPFEDPPRVDMRGVSSESGHPDEDLNGCAELVDGGLLENMPLAWAVRAVAGAPAARKADRRLLFLRPVPPFPPPPGPAGGRGFTRLVRTAAKSLAVKAGSESLREDALALRAAEAEAEQQRAVLAVLPPTLTELYHAAMARLDPYARAAGRAEAQRLIRLLADPAEVTGPDELPLPVGPGPLEALDGSAAEGPAALFARLRRASDGLAVAPGTLPGPGYSPLALARTVRLLTDWLTAYESGAGPVYAELVEAYRTQLFACRSAVAALTAARDRLLLGRYRAALSPGLMPSDPAAAYGEATRLLGALMPPVPPPGAAPAHWETWTANLATAVCAGSLPEVPATGPAAVPEGFGHLWERLADLGQEIGLDLSPDVDGYEALHAAARGAGPPMAEALAYAEVLLGPLRPDPLAGGADIGFHTVSAAEPSWATRTVLPQVAPDCPQDLVGAKPSGNRPNDLATLLSARRRMSDWTWGRLDGAAALVSVVATDERLHDAFGDPADLTALGEEIAGEMALGPPFTELWAQDVTARPDVAPWDRVRDVLTAVRQHEVLDEELPLLAELHRKGFRGGNRPPDSPPNPPGLPTRAAFDAALASLREIGAEDAGRLLRARDPRRAVLRTGLVAWQALQPTGRAGARLVQGILGVLKPLVCLPVLVGVLAPVPALGAAVLLWTGVAFSTGHWSSLPGHVPVCLYAMVALAALVRQRIRPAPLRVPALLVALAGPPVALWQLRGLHTPDVGDGARTLIVGAAFALAAAAVLYVGTDRWALLPGAAAVAGVIAGLVQFGRPGLGGWWAALILCAVLSWVTFVLPWLYPRPPLAGSGSAGLHTGRRSAPRRSLG
ncbi:patatin-like phospholipase family protein [Streptomyces sp. R33]|uniref:Patatin-like phospholipase family protein n=1 Tax=Streptomyces sp. R33 TaxID=3238629 RepID=A0AB39XZN6_9ACTN